MESGHAEEAKSALVRAVESDPALAEARYQLAFALSALGDYQGALQETKRALELDPYFPNPRFRLLIDLQFEEASVLAPELDASERVKAGAAIEQFDFKESSLDDLFPGFHAPDAFPGPRDAPTAHAHGASATPGAEVTARQGLPSEATPAGELSLDAAREAMSKGQLERASQEAQRAGLLGANRTDLLLVQGEIFLRRGFAGEAVERFYEVLRNAPETDLQPGEPVRLALLGSARSNLLLGRISEARLSAEKLAHHWPYDAEPLSVLGQVLSAAGYHDQAVEVFERASAISPEDASILTDLGRARLGAMDLAGGEKSLRGAIALDPFAVAARATLGRLLADSGRTDEAVVELQEALDLLPGYGEAAMSLAELEWRRGHPTAAMHTLVDLLTVDPYHFEALAHLGTWLIEAGAPRDAATAFRRVLSFAPEHEVALAGLDRAIAESPVGRAG